MSLPDSWVESLFKRLAVRYGAAWLRMWEGVDVAAIKADWADVLGGFQPEDIRFALNHLPADRPPNAMQFRDLCRRAPDPAVQMLPAPTPNPMLAREVLSLSRTAVRRPNDRLGWARELQHREEAGESLTKAQRQAWREALEELPELEVLTGAFCIPGAEALPPEMRDAS